MADQRYVGLVKRSPTYSHVLPNHALPNYLAGLCQIALCLRSFTNRRKYDCA